MAGASGEHSGLEATLAQLGHFGIYQKYVFFMLCAPNILAAMYSLNYVFVAAELPHRCVIPECEGAPPYNLTNADAIALLPDTRCRRYDPLVADSGTNLTCAADDFQNITIACEEFVYESLDTIFSEFDLGCRDWMRTMVGTVRNAALPVALILTGFVSDTYGRRTAFCIFSACIGLMGIIKSLSVNYNMYLTMEFFEAALGYGFNSAGYVMMIELAHPSLRGIFACATGAAYGIGGVLFALLAWLVPNWRNLLRVMHAPALLLPMYWFIMDESMRWLHAKGRGDDTERVVKKAARWNKIVLDEESLKALQSGNSATTDTKPQSSWRKLLRSRVLLLRFLLCCWCWIASSFVYYGLTINSVSLAGDRYVNFALNMSMEIVASLLLMMSLERLGRRRSVLIAFLLCGVACVTPYFIEHHQTNLGLYFAGKLAITCAFNAVYVLTAELFPTNVRSTALSAASLVGRIGSILAPQTPLLGLTLQAFIYAVISLTAALCVLFLPETLGAALPQHIPETTATTGPQEIMPQS